MARLSLDSKGVNLIMRKRSTSKFTELLFIVSDEICSFFSVLMLMNTSYLFKNNTTYYIYIVQTEFIYFKTSSKSPINITK